MTAPHRPIAGPWADERIAENDRTVRENFGDWFGQSKVLDAFGRPLTVFHGTGRKFDAFDLARASDPENEDAIFFTDLREQAQEYGEVIVSAYLRIERPYRMGWRDWIDSVDPSIAEIRARGFDGVVISDFDTGYMDATFTRRAHAYLVFTPGQIKSADLNSGLYLRNSHSLTDQDAERDLRLAREALGQVGLADRRSMRVGEPA